MTAPSEICQSAGGTIVAGNPCHLSPAAVTDGFGDWQYVLNVRPSDAIKLSLAQRFYTTAASSGPAFPVYHQIELATGDINLDFYVVYIHSLPTIGGNQVSANGLLDYVRTHLGDFMDHSSSGANVWFRNYEERDRLQWTSSDPLGTVMHFSINGDNWEASVVENLSVVATEMASDHWIFSTIWTPKDLGHPVSGNRQFGMAIRRPADTYAPPYSLVFGDPVTTDTLYFYTRGADRCTTIADAALAGVVFNGGHMCWLGLTQKVQQFVKDNGGDASFQGAISDRHDWGAISATYWKSPAP
jgi:hypothetical protein